MQGGIAMREPQDESYGAVFSAPFEQKGLLLWLYYISAGLYKWRLCLRCLWLHAVQLVVD